jgi:Tol biopolymer transport system component
LTWQHGGRAKSARIAAAMLACLIALPAIAGAQYFGRNKVQYRTFDFQILQTEHFDLYYYPEEKEAAYLASRLSERWYARLSRFFDHQLRGRQVLILYASPSHFRQTNAVEGLIGEGTGGVTEAFKRRVVLPMAGSLADTDHVIGHELVHAFQFDMTGSEPRDDDGGAPGILGFPLWFVEGMAEYLSLGPIDAQTSMWMRDAVLREHFPDIQDLEKPEYFPYRWGHAFWAFIGAKFGDRAVGSLVRSAANPRFDLVGLARQLGTTPEELNADWHRAIRSAAAAGLAEQPAVSSEITRVISEDSGAGRFNVGPRLSPDGRYVAFFSEKDRFSIDLYLAEADSGRIQRKLIGSATDGHFDSLQFLNSAGAWSPDSKYLAVTAVRGGDTVLALIEPRSGKNAREIVLPGLDEAINPSFSYDGRSVVLSGTRGGFADLFVVSLETGRLEALTNDPFADLEPAFTPDGRSVVFVTERYTTDLVELAPGALRLARVSLDSKTVEAIPAFLKGKQISPQVSPDGQWITFVADPDGICNLYRIAIDGGPVSQISSVPTGVAGITTSSPALSTASTGRLAFSVFENSGHAIYLLDPSRIVATVPPAADGGAAVLAARSSPGDVQRMLTDTVRGLPADTPAPPSQPYSGKLTLDMVGRPTISAGISQFGGFLGGGMSAFFSDMLGDRSLVVGGQVASDLEDFGATLAYINRRHRWNWALIVEETPYRVDYLTAAEDAGGTVTLTDRIDRQKKRGVTGVASMPLSRATRLEFSGGAHSLSVTHEIKTVRYGTSGAFWEMIEKASEKLPAEKTLYLADGGTALVHDTSYYGPTSPIYGRRYRLQASRHLGSLNYTTVLVDARQYFMPKRPVTFALRAMHFGRYGRDADAQQLPKLYAGYPELVRGYGLGTISPEDCRFVVGGYECDVANDLAGSRMLVANAEVRAPLIGLLRRDLQYGPVPIELVAFADAGLTWTRTERPVFAGGTRDLLRSVGGAARVNVLGFMIVEVAASRPLDRLARGWQWQLSVKEGF